MSGRLFFVNKAFWNMVPKVWHDFGKGGGHAGRGKTGKWHDFGEKGNQYARSHLTRLPLKEDK